MAQDICVLTLVGRLTRDPEVRYTAGGTAVLAGRLGYTTRRKQGEEWTDASNFLDVTLAFGNRAESLGRLLTKGSRIGITGRLEWREWTDKSGEKRQSYQAVADDVQLLDSRDGGQETRQPAAGGSGAPKDDIPFGPSWA